MENFEKNYKELIEQHLPSHLSKTLQEKLAEADRLQKENKELNSKLELLTSINAESQETISKLRAEVTECATKSINLRIKEETLRTQEKDLEMREIRVLNEIVRKEMAQKHTEDFKNILTTVFANKQVFESITESQNGQWEWNTNTQKNEFIPTGKSTNIIKS